MTEGITEGKGNVGAKLVRTVKNNIKIVAGTKNSKTQTRLPNRIKLLISIVNRNEDARLNEILDEFSISLSFTFAGTGTARSQVLDYLGIGETEKAVILSLIPESDEEAIMREIRAKLSLYLAGKGISFTVPLTGISEIVANGLLGAAKDKSIDGRKIMQNADRQYDLIIVAMEANHVDEAMTAARIAGAAGGTIIRSRSVNNEKAEQFIGISLTQEQEILLILTKREGKLAIMQALSDRVGLKTDAGGVIFSVPVDKTAGIAVTAEENEGNGSQNDGQ